jgi:hypothetical protein
VGASQGHSQEPKEGSNGVEDKQMDLAKRERVKEEGLNPPTPRSRQPSQCAVTADFWLEEGDFTVCMGTRGIFYGKMQKGSFSVVKFSPILWLKQGSGQMLTQLSWGKKITGPPTFPSPSIRRK